MGSRKSGFGSMTPERRKEVAAKGGKASQATGKAHRWTSKEAREAGARGGASAQRKREKVILDLLTAEAEKHKLGYQ